MAEPLRNRSREEQEAAFAAMAATRRRHQTRQPLPAATDVLFPGWRNLIEEGGGERERPPGQPTRTDRAMTASAIQLVNLRRTLERIMPRTTPTSVHEAATRASADIEATTRPEPAVIRTERGAIAQRRGYWPTGMALEASGRQSFRGRSYPPNVPINEDVQYRPETKAVMEQWRDQIQPYRPKEYSPEAVSERLQKFKWLSHRLAEIYGIPEPNLRLGRMDARSWTTPSSSGSSCYRPSDHSIAINGKFSVVTFLHEFGHARGFDETDATIWSINLFKRVYPESYAKLGSHGHVVVQRPGKAAMRPTSEEN